MAKKIYIGILVLVILTASIYIFLPNNVRIDVGKTYTTFKVYENENWVLAGTERTILMDGTKKMRAWKREVNYTIEDNITTIYRYAYFKDNITAIDTYVFDGGIKNVELFPISHKVNIINGEGKIFLYEVKDLLYTGETKSDIKSPQLFGHNIKIWWEEGNYYSKIYKYVGKDEGKLSIRYKVNSEDFTKNVRLFDPPIEGNDLIVANGETVTLGGDVDTYDTVWVQTGGTLQINSTDKYLNLIANKIIIDGEVDGTGMYAGGVAISCASSTKGFSGYSGSGLSPGGGGPGDDSDYFNYGLGGGSGGNARPHIRYHTSSCDGYYYYIGEGGGYCGAFDVWKSGGAAGGASASTETDFNFTAGSGGGSGGCYHTAHSGFGGTGAGYIILNAPIVDIHGTINLDGKNGGSASVNDGAAGGGGGGSGGSLGIFGNAVDISSSTIKINGGNGGSGATDGAGHGTSGGTGSGGRVKIFYETFDNTSASITLGDYGTYYATEIALPVSTIVSDDRNLTTEAISLGCNNTMNSYGINNYTWAIYNNSVEINNGTTNAVSGYINVANYPANYFSHNDSVELKCTLNYGEQNITDTLEIIMHQPIWINITSPSEGAILQNSYHTIEQNFENYTEVDSCWYTNDSGITNQSITCGADISANWLEDNNTVTIYSNASNYNSYETSDTVSFTTVIGPADIEYTEPTPENGTWLSQDYLNIAAHISNCESFKNATYHLRSIIIDIIGVLI